MYFIGTGYAFDDMKQMVIDHGLDDKTEFKGLILERELIKKYYAAADLFLFPSIYDNAPLVVREAGALQTPSVLVKGSTASEIITDNLNGFLIENSAESLANKIRELASPAFTDKERRRKRGPYHCPLVAGCYRRNLRPLSFFDAKKS